MRPLLASYFESSILAGRGPVGSAIFRAVGAKVIPVHLYGFLPVMKALEGVAPPPCSVGVDELTVLMQLKGQHSSYLAKIISFALFIGGPFHSC